MFTAIPLPDPVRTALRGAQSELSACWDTTGVNWTSPDNMHITLKFLGEVPDDMVGALREALRQVEMIPATLHVDHITGFPKRGKAHVIVGALAGECQKVSLLFDQIEKVCEPFGIPRERRAYTPHVTIGRSCDGVNLARHEALPRFSGPTFGAANFDLVKSQLTTSGPIYERIETYNAH